MRPRLAPGAPAPFAARAARYLVATLGLGAAAFGCSDVFVAQSSIQSLRVLGVQVTPPYAAPGDKVSLEMLYYDGSPKAFDAAGKRTRQVQILWLGGCHDPIGDLYYSCFPQLAQQFARLFPPGSGPGGTAGSGGSGGAAGASGGPPGGVSPDLLKALFCENDNTDAEGNVVTEGRGALLATGTRYDCLKVPRDIIARKPAAQLTSLIADDNVPYGLSYVFYAVCGGTLAPASPEAFNGVPLACLDNETGQPLGADDFVFGYTPIYSYGRPKAAPDPSLENPAIAADPTKLKQLTNSNPILVTTSAGVPKMTFEGKVYDTPCSSGCPEGSACGQAGVCIPEVPHCTEKKVLNCPTYTIKPEVDQKSVEKDEASPPFQGRVPDEVIWASYYASDGTLEKDTTLVNDANKGWNEAYETKWSAPDAAAGVSRVWVVVHDNRGGTSWAWQDLMIK
jgi:hypothetical protein